MSQLQIFPSGPNNPSPYAQAAKRLLRQSWNTSSLEALAQEIYAIFSTPVTIPEAVTAQANTLLPYTGANVPIPVVLYGVISGPQEGQWPITVYSTDPNGSSPKTSAISATQLGTATPGLTVGTPVMVLGYPNGQLPTYDMGWYFFTVDNQATANTLEPYTGDDLPIPIVLYGFTINAITPPLYSVAIYGGNPNVVGPSVTANATQINPTTPVPNDTPIMVLGYPTGSLPDYTMVWFFFVPVYP